ncbi:PAS domain S-box protein [bacterium]|nr:PAS domain S-box protein [bacterium]
MEIIITNSSNFRGGAVSCRGEVPALLLKQMRDRYAFEIGERDKFGRSAFTIRAFAEIPEVYLDDRFSIIGFSSNFPLLSERLPQLAHDRAHLKELLDEEGYSRIKKHLEKMKDICSLNADEESGWNPVYTGPSEQDKIGVNWFCHHACGDHWQIKEQDGKWIIFHHPHVSDSLNCYLMYEEPLCRPDEDIRITFRIKTSLNPDLIRDLSLVISGYSGREHPLCDLTGYAFCTASNYNLEARIQRQGANLASTMEILEPGTEYEITASRIGGKLKRSIRELSSGKHLTGIESTDINACYDRRPYFGFTTFSGEACIYEVKVFTRKSQYDIRQFQFPLDIETGLKEDKPDGRVFRVHMGTDVSLGESVHTLIFQDVTSETSLRKELEARLRLENQISAFSRNIIIADPQSIDLEIDKILGFIGNLAEADRVHLSLYDQDGNNIVLANYWCREGLSPQTDLIRKFVSDQFPGKKEISQKAGAFTFFPDQSLASKNKKARKHFNTIGTKSLLIAPVVSSERIVGLLGIHSMAENKEWMQELRITVSTLTDIVSNALSIKRHILALEQSENKFKSLVEESLDIIYKFQVYPEVKINYLSPAIETFFGYSRDEYYARNGLILEIVHPDDRQQLIKLLNNPWEYKDLPKNEKRRECRCISKSGDIIWVSFTFSFYVEPDNSAIFIYGTSRDITARKKIAEELDESRRAMTALLGNLPGMVYRCVMDGKDCIFTFASEGCRELTGYTVSELVGKSRCTLVTAEDYRILKSNLEIAVASRRPFELNYRIVTLNGPDKWVLEKGSCVYGEDGQPVAVEGFITDISDRRKAEEEVYKSQKMLELTVKERTAELQKSEKDLKKQVKQLSCRNQIRAEFEKGANLSDILNNVAFIIKDSYADPQERLVVIFYDGKSYPENNQVSDSGYISSKIVITGVVKGSITVFSTSATWDMPFDQNHLDEISGLLSDYLHRRELLLENLSINKIALTGRIASEIAQTLSDPLSTIKNSLYIIGKSFTPENPDYVYLQLLNSEINHISQTLSHLYELYGRTHATPGSIADILKQVTRMFEKQLKARNIEMVFDINTDISVAPAKVSVIKQIVHNCLEQLIPVSRGGLITVTASEKGNLVIIRIDSLNSIVEQARIRSSIESSFTMQPNLEGTLRGVGIGFSTARTLLESIGGFMKHNFDGERNVSFLIHLPLN